MCALLAGTAHAQDAGVFSTTVTDLRDPIAPARATTTVNRGDLDRRLPRSAPDAVRFEPGVFVQQTAHSQGSVFLRGLTGQQTVVLFDGVRLNTSTWRAGPNQYFFTLDSATIETLDVLRGGASTLFGADALGGVIAATPIEAPRMVDGPFVRPKLLLKGTTADAEAGGRVQLQAAAGTFGFIGGVGGRRVGLLESAGGVRSVITGELPDVPRFQPDARTQLGTGFNELTGDARLTWRPDAKHSVTAALYAYRQFDAPRTDQCPPPGARSDECLTIKEQFRTLTYLSWNHAGDELAWKLTASWQRHHELRAGARPASFVLSTGRDVVDSLGLNLRATTRNFSPVPWVLIQVIAGVDSTLDLVESRAWLSFSDIDVTVERSRGQYLTGARAIDGGGFVTISATQARVALRGGARLGWSIVTSPADPESSTSGLAKTWLPFAATGGVDLKVHDLLTVTFNADRSFRAPNLDDLTSRQQTGPGFQFENPALKPETTSTLEFGLRVHSDWLNVDAWAFQTWLTGAIGKRPVSIEDCPPATPQCNASWSRLQLVNAPGLSSLRGAEGLVRARLPVGLAARASVSLTWGEGPNLVGRPVDDAVPWQPTVPLSRIPPLNGTVELSWTHAAGLGLTAALKWAAAQTRLALADQADARIPLGGTPGYAVLDLRFHARLNAVVALSVVVENLFDLPWRTHGSSINGAGRGVMLSFAFTPWP